MTSTRPDPMMIPIALGDNAVYGLRLAEGGIVLVDAGPDLPDLGGAGLDGSWGELVAQAAAHGFTPADVRAVIVTHAHLDHCGLARRWVEAGARVLAGAADVPALESGAAWNEARVPLRIATLRRHGCPPELAQRLASSTRRRAPQYRWEACPRGSVEAAVDGTEFALEGGAILRIVLAPGHTPGNLVAFVPESGDLYSGDTLLPGTVATPGIHFTADPTSADPSSADGAPGPRWPSLPPFVDSVRRLRALGVRRVLPGHGAPSDDPDRLFDRFEAHNARRGARVRRLLAERPDSAYGLVMRLFPHLPEARVAQAMTELIGHLDLLEANGEAVPVGSEASEGFEESGKSEASTQPEESQGFKKTSEVWRYRLR